jgi:tetratricopeptide (TPR) repeat protein
MTPENSVTENSIRDEKLNAALEALESARELQKLRRSHGVDRIHLLVEDVEGDWLEEWGNDEILDSEEFQDKLNFLAAVAHREEFQNGIQRTEEKIAETDLEIQELSERIKQRIRHAYQELPNAIPTQRFVVQSHESEIKPPASLVENVDRIVALSTLVSFEPTAEDYFRLGNARFIESLFEGAIADYDKALELKLNFAEALCNKGAALAQIQNYEEAITVLQKAIEIEPSFATAWHNLGIVLAKIHNYPDANESYLKALELQPDSVDTYLSLGNSLFCAGHYQDALKVNEKLLEIKPDYYEAWNNRGTVLSKLGKSEEAIDSFNRALKINPSYVQSFYNTGNIFYGCEQYAKAIAEYDKALQLMPSFHEAWVNRGNALGYLNQDEEAITSFKQVTTSVNASKFPDVYRAWIGLGNSLEKLGQKDEAIEAYRKIFELQSNDAQAWHRVGVGLGALGQYSEAKTALKTASKLESNPSSAAVIFFHLGVINAEMKCFAEAISHYEHAVHLDPCYVEALNRLGVLLHEQFQEYESAIKIYNRIVEIKSDEAVTFFNRACSCSRLKKTDQAVEDLKRAIELDPTFRDKAKTDSDFDAIRNDDRFQQLLKDEVVDSLASARLRGAQNQQALLYEDGEPLQKEEVAKLLNISLTSVDEYRKNHQILGISSDNSRYLYPRFQFKDHQILSGLALVLQALKHFDPSMQLMFLKTGDMRLDGETPLSYLQAGRIDEVLRAAESYGEQSAT